MGVDRVLSALLVALVIGLALLVFAQQRELAAVAAAVGRTMANEKGSPEKEAGDGAV